MRLVRGFRGRWLLCMLFGYTTAYGASHTITQKGKVFKKDGTQVKDLTISVGDTIEFVNDDTTSHNVFSTSSQDKFNLKIQAPNSKSSYTFKNKGEVTVRCAIHPKMKINIKVN